MVAVTSARCYLSLLEEKDEEILQHAVEKLNEVVDDFWAEISESVDLMYVFLLPFLSSSLPSVALGGS